MVLGTLDAHETLLASHVSATGVERDRLDLDRGRPPSGIRGSGSSGQVIFSTPFIPAEASPSTVTLSLSQIKISPVSGLRKRFPNEMSR